MGRSICANHFCHHGLVKIDLRRSIASPANVLEARESVQTRSSCTAAYSLPRGAVRTAPRGAAAPAVRCGAAGWSESGSELLGAAAALLLSVRARAGLHNNKKRERHGWNGRLSSVMQLWAHEM